MKSLARTFAAAALLAAMPTLAQSPATPQFLPGEEMIFSVDWLHIHTGEARISVGAPDGDVWPIVCQAKTEGLASLVNIREQYISYWDALTRFPRGSDLAAQEAGDRHMDFWRFDRDANKATVRVTRHGKANEHVYDLPHGAQDVASALLFIRLQPLAPGDHVELPVFTGAKTFTLAVDVVGREHVDTPAGRFDTVKVSMRLGFEGKFASRRETFVWMSDDPRHVPVQISAEFAVGSVVATLTHYKPGQEVAQR